MILSAWCRFDRFPCVLLLAASAALAPPASAADKFATDRKGGSDSAVVGRYQGSVLYTYGFEKLGTTDIVVEQKGKPVVQAVEGRISTKLYLAPKGSSPVEVHRNYRHALEQAGFETLYACELAACLKDDVQGKVQQLPRKTRWIASENGVDGTFNSGNQPGFHYYSGRKMGPGGPTYVTVALADRNDRDGLMSYLRQFVQIVEPATAELGKITVDAKAIEAGLKRDGKMALYGVNFDTNKALLRDDSAAELEAMAAVLKATPAMKVFIVGHTDNQGEFAANTALSQKRAEAVAAALSGKYGIAPARLLARGVANLAPVASNEGEEGRAKNRRVEMVLR